MAHEKTPAAVGSGGRGAKTEGRPHRSMVAAALATEPLLTVADITAALGCSRRWLEQARAGGRFPVPDCQVGRHPRWRRSTVSAWIARGGSR